MLRLVVLQELAITASNAYDPAAQIGIARVIRGSTLGHCLKTQVFYHRGEVQRAQSFKTVSILTGFCDASAYSACSAVKLKDIVISLGKSPVPYAGIKRSTYFFVAFSLAKRNIAAHTRKAVFTRFFCE